MLSPLGALGAPRRVRKTGPAQAPHGLQRPRGLSPAPGQRLREGGTDGPTHIWRRFFKRLRSSASPRTSGRLLPNYFYFIRECELAPQAHPPRQDPRVAVPRAGGTGAQAGPQDPCQGSGAGGPFGQVSKAWAWPQTSLAGGGRGREVGTGEQRTGWGEERGRRGGRGGGSSWGGRWLPGCALFLPQSPRPGQGAGPPSGRDARLMPGAWPPVGWGTAQLGSEEGGWEVSRPGFALPRLLLSSHPLQTSGSWGASDLDEGTDSDGLHLPPACRGPRCSCSGREQQQPGPPARAPARISPRDLSVHHPTVTEQSIHNGPTIHSCPLSCSRGHKQQAIL